MLKRLQRKYACSEKGARDMVKATVACVVSNLVLMLPVTLLYYLMRDLLAGGMAGSKNAFYIVGIFACLALIAFTTYVQYNATYLTTYVESGVRRVTLAEKLRKLPLSFFGKKDLSDLTSVVMADCATLETASSHWIPELWGSLISTGLIAISLFFFDWRMALAALWVLPVSIGIVTFSSKVQVSFGKKQMALKMACADGIQECLESVRDLKANNAEGTYLAGLDHKIHAVEKRAIITELGVAMFVVSASMILKLGIATVALVGGALLANGSLSLLTFFMFLLLVSRLYDPMQAALINLGAVISARVQCERMNEILGHPVQTGTKH